MDYSYEVRVSILGEADRVLPAGSPAGARSMVTEIVGRGLWTTSKAGVTTVVPPHRILGVTFGPVPPAPAPFEPPVHSI